MKTPVRALLWEQWRRTRWAWAAVFAVCTVVSLYCALSHRLPHDFQVTPELSRDFRSFAVILYLLTLFLPLDGSEVKLGLPRYMMTLPSRTRVFAETQLSVGLISAFFLVTLNELIPWLFRVGAPHWEFVAFVVSLTALLYALFWTIGVAAARPTLFIATSLAITLVYTHNVQESFAVLFLAPEAALTVLGVALACWGIRQDRSGDIAPGIVTMRPGAPRPQRKPAAPATFWDSPGLKPLFLMEWKRTYRYIPLVTTSAIVMSLLFLPLMGVLRGSEFEPLRTLTFFLPPLICGITGLLRDTWDYRAYRSGQNFPDFCRPVSDKTIVHARWLAGAAAIVTTQVLMGALLALTAYLIHSRYFDTVTWSILLVAAAQWMVCWIALWFSPVMLLFALVLLGDIPHSLATLVLLALAAFGLLKIVPLAVARGVVSLNSIAVGIVFWVGLSAIWYENQGTAFRWSEDGALVVTVLIGCLTLAWTPLMVHTMRHRR